MTRKVARALWCVHPGLRGLSSDGTLLKNDATLAYALTTALGIYGLCEGVTRVRLPLDPRGLRRHRILACCIYIPMCSHPSYIVICISCHTILSRWIMGCTCLRHRAQPPVRAGGRYYDSIYSLRSTLSVFLLNGPWPPSRASACASISISWLALACVHA